MADDFDSFVQQNAPNQSAPLSEQAQQSTAQPDPFESFVRDQVAQQQKISTTQAQAGVIGSSDVSSDTAGRAAQIGRQIGAPQAAVETDLPRYEAQAKAQQGAQTLVNNPFLSDWAAKNPDSAKVARDQLSDMSDLQLIASQQIAGEAGDLLKGLARGFGTSFNNASLAVNRAIGAAASGVDKVAGSDLSDWWYQHMVAPALQNRQSLTTPTSAPFGVKAADVVGNMLGMLVQIAGTGGVGEAAAGGEAAQTAAQAIGKTAAHGARAMVFPALTSATNTGADVYDQTGDMAQAIRAAQMSYATTTLGGIVPLGATGNLATRLVSGFASGAVSSEVSRQAMNLVMPQQEGFDPVNTILSGLSGAILSGAMGSGPLHDGVRQTFSDGLAADTAVRGGAALEQISQLAQASKLRQYDPDAFKRYVAAAAEDGPIQSVYVDGKTVSDALAQSPIDTSQMPDFGQRVEEAVKTGGDVQIPVEDYATHIAGTPLDAALMQHIKTEEGGPTYSEGQQFFQNAKEEMAKRAAEIEQAAKPLTVEEQDMRNIGDTLMEQMKATGRYPEDVARASLSPVLAFYRTMAERAGMTPGEMFQQYPLRIAGERGTAEDLEHGGVEQPGEPEGQARGAFSPSERTISLLQNADLSTFLHESGHFFLTTMGDIAGRADAPEQIKQDMQTAIEWMGGKDLADWQGRMLNEQRDMHEKFARGFESYLMEGKAPTTAMAGLFARFRAWLTNVYRNISSLNAPLTDEVRGVFDRLLASDQMIREAEAARGYLPLDLTKAGATPEQQAAYEKQGQDATQAAVDEMTKKSIGDMKWASRAKAKAIRQMQREANAQRDLIREEVTREVDESPVEKARNFISAHDLKTTDSAAMDLVAEQFGIGSGTELVGGLSETKEQKQTRIDDMTDQRMLERHGELVDPQAIEDAANAAVHNDVRARFMATGLKLLLKSKMAARDLAKAAEEAARTTIAGKRVKDVSARQYEVAETKANREALELAPKDPAKAVESQRRALLSNRLAKAARDALDDIKSIVKSQARYDKASVRAKVDPDILDQIDALRERFDFRQRPPEGPTKRQVALQDWMTAQKAFGYAPVEHPDMLNPAVRMHYKDMTVEQLRGFNDTIRSLEQIGRERKSITIAGKKVDLAEAVGELVDKMKARGESFTMKDIVQPPRKGVDPLFKVALDRMQSWLRASIAELKPQQYKANRFDQHEILGPFTRMIFDRVFDANYHKVDMLKRLSDDFRATAESLGKDWQRSLTELVPNARLLDADLTKEAGEPIYRQLTRGDVLGIARHVGNESNFDKLTKGMDWQPRDVWAFLNEHMRPEDWKATQATWDSFEKFWPEMVEMNKRLGQVAPERIEPRAFRTPDGIEMRGGYAPIDYDALRSKLAVRKQDASAINPSEGLFGKGYFRADTTTNGSLNSRVANYFDRIDLGYHSLERRLHDTIHDLAYREALLDVHKILSHPDFRRQFQLTYGKEEYQHLQEWVGDLANGPNSDAQMSRLGQIMESARHMMVANGIALRVSTMVKHGGSALAKSAGYFSGGGMKYFRARAAQMAKNHAQMISSAIEKFPEIRARAMQQDRDFRQTSSSLFEPESFHGKAERFGHAAVAYLDLCSAVPTAWAAYDRAITEGIPTNRGGTGQPMSEEDAVNYANQIVREAHGSQIESARSDILRSKSEATKMMTTLYGFMNNSLGQAMDMGSKLRTAGFSKPEILARFLMASIVPALAAGVVEGKKKDEGWAKWAAGAISGEFAGMVPGLRDAWSALKGCPDAGLSPFMRILSAGGKPFKDAWDAAHGKQPKKPIRDIGNAVGLGIPGAGQIGTTVQYAVDVATGKTHPKGVGDVARGLAFGQEEK
jgi:hypothetical protein